MNRTCALSGPIANEAVSILRNHVANDPLTFGGQLTFFDSISDDDDHRQQHKKIVDIDTGFYKKICITGSFTLYRRE